MNQTIALLASDSSHLPLLTVFKESKVSKKYGFDIDLHIVGEPLAPTMEHRSRLVLSGEIEFLSGLHHETYRARARGEKRLMYIAQAQNNWDDRLVVSPMIHNVEDLKGKALTCHSKAHCVQGNLVAVLESCGLKREDINVEAIEDSSGDYRFLVDRVKAGEVAGTLIDMPYDLYGEKLGLKILPLPDRPVVHNTTLLTTTDYARENEKTVIAFIKAFIEAVHFFKTKPQEVVSILKINLSKRLGLKEEEYFIHLQKEWARLLSVKPYPLASAIHNVFELDAAHDPKVKGMSSMEPWNLHYLRLIDDSGFIDQLYGNSMT